ncbi:MAG TPA: PQQ-binding-like beta-propeller repeat protein [Thermoguttaceae bacterium]|nr:PQQ-binding-like beta-propeller repeat protein [Thermoguttaceae bacterium]
MKHARWNLCKTAVALALMSSVSAAAPAQPFAQGVLPGGAVSPDMDDASAADVFPAPDRKLLLWLAKAEELLEEDYYEAAVGYLGRILEEPGDHFFQPNKNLPIYSSLKSEAWRLIGGMPSQGREFYELQYGPGARRLLEEAVAAADMSRLAEVSRRFFHTEAGYEATFLLGLHHFDHAEPLAGALALQRLRDATRSADRFEPTLSLILASCWLKAEAPEKARDVLAPLARQQRDGSVEIAGERAMLFAREGEAVLRLTGLIGPQLPVAAMEAQRWMMFCGNPARNASVAGSAPLLNRRWAVTGTEAGDAMRELQRSSLEQGIPLLPGLHPLAVNDVVLLRNDRDLVAVEFLKDGKLKWLLSPEDTSPGIGFAASSAASHRATIMDIRSRMCHDATYGTLSTDGRFVFSVETDDLPWDPSSQRTVVIGSRSTSMPEASYNELVAGDVRNGKRKWILGGPTQPDSLDYGPWPLAGTYFLGPPLPLMGKLYVLAEIKDEIRLLVLDPRKQALDPHKGDVLWEQRLAMVDQGTLSDPWRRRAGVSPSYADGILVCPTSTGAIVAVDPTSRSLLWGFPYECRKTSSPSHAMFIAAGGVVRYSPTAPPTDCWCDGSVRIAEGSVLATPIESDWLYCLNLIDGNPRWKYPRGDNLYAACVHQGKVILVGRNEVRGLSLQETVEVTEKGPEAEPLEAQIAQRTLLYERIKAMSTSQAALIKTQIDELKKQLEEVPDVVVRRPKPAWDGRPVVLPDGSVPSGRGFLAGDEYYLPLSSAEIVAIDLRAGKIVHTSKSRDGKIPGNLICYKGCIISQGFDGVEAFYQTDAAREAIARLGPDKPESLTLEGELLWDEGKHAEAVDRFRRAFELGGDLRTRGLLREALLEGLRVEFAAHRDSAEEIERLLDTPEQRAAFVRLMATGLRHAGQWRAALEEYLKLADPEQDVYAMEAVTKSHWVRRDRWLRAQLAALRAEVGDDAAAIDEPINALLQAALDAPDNEALRRFVDCFGDSLSGAEARRVLARRLKDSGKPIQAEMLLWYDARSPDRTVAAASTVELAELLRASKRPEDAAWCYRRLREQFADVLCPDGRTGSQWADAVPADDAIGKALQRDAEWPVGKVEVGQPEALTSVRAGRFPVVMEGDPGPFFANGTIRFDNSVRNSQGRTVPTICGWDAVGNEQWQTPLVDAGSLPTLRYDLKRLHARTCGHLLMVSTGYSIVAVDALGSAADGTPQLLWKQETPDAQIAAADVHQILIQRAALGLPYSSNSNLGQQIGALGPVTQRYVCFQEGGKLVAADPLTGEPLWIQRYVAPDSVVFGDEQYVFALAPDKDEAAVYGALDGELLGKRKIPRGKMAADLGPAVAQGEFVPFTQECLAMAGRRVLLWQLAGNRSRLQLFDPWLEREVWPPREFTAEAKVCVVGQEAVGVFEPDGRFVLVGLSEGRTIVDAKLNPERQLIDISVFRFGDRYVLITNGEARSSRSYVQPIHTVPDDLYKMIGYGWVYAFDLQGKPLWPEPVKIENQQFAGYQPDRLPVLTFFYQTYQGSPRRYEIALECIDKRTGHKIRLKDFPQMTTPLQLVGDPEADTVEVQLGGQKVTMSFTDEPWPAAAAEEEDQTGVDRAKTGRALAATLKNVVAGALGKPAQVEETVEEELEDLLPELPVLPPAPGPR